MAKFFKVSPRPRISLVRGRPALPPGFFPPSPALPKHPGCRFGSLLLQEALTGSQVLPEAELWRCRDLSESLLPEGRQEEPAQPGVSAPSLHPSPQPSSLRSQRAGSQLAPPARPPQTGLGREKRGFQLPETTNKIKKKKKKS